MFIESWITQQARTTCPDRILDRATSKYGIPRRLIYCDPIQDSENERRKKNCRVKFIESWIRHVWHSRKTALLDMRAHE